MKRYLYFAFLFLCSKVVVAQDSSAALSMDTAAYHYGNATTNRNFEVKRAPIVYRRAFKVNTAKTQQEVYDRALAFARMENTNYNSDSKKGKISLPITWEYKGGFNECVEDLAITATLTLEVKDTKTRISLTDITYQHKDKDDKNARPVAKTDFFTTYPACAPASGKAELLYNCSDCSRSIKSIDKNFQLQFETLATQYQEWLKKY